LIKIGNYDPSKSASWKVLETVLSHLKWDVDKKRELSPEKETVPRRPN